MKVRRILLLLTAVLAFVGTAPSAAAHGSDFGSVARDASGTSRSDPAGHGDAAAKLSALPALHRATAAAPGAGRRFGETGPRLVTIAHGAGRVGDDGAGSRIEVRAAKLQHRAGLRALRPRVDEHGLVRVGDRWIDLPPVQLPVAGLLISRFGRLVTAEQIQAAYLNASGSMHPKAVKAMIGRVKRRLAELDLVLLNVRDRGYLLEAAGPGSPGGSMQPDRQE